MRGGGGARGRLRLQSFGRGALGSRVGVWRGRHLFRRGRRQRMASVVALCWLSDLGIGEGGGKNVL